MSKESSSQGGGRSGINGSGNSGAAHRRTGQVTTSLPQFIEGVSRYNLPAPSRLFLCISPPQKHGNLQMACV